MRLAVHHTTIEGRSVRLLPAQAEHVDAYCSVLTEQENRVLFQQLYHVEPAEKDDLLAAIMKTPSAFTDALDKTTTWSVLDRATNVVIGWATLTIASATPELAECALFLRRLQRSERGSECMFYLHIMVFNEMNLQRLEFRTGALDDSEVLGSTIVGVLQRQLLDKARSQGSDLYVITRKQWPVIRRAVEAWLEMKKIPTPPGS